MNQYYLQHHGIIGQKWGIRRYQNPDGTLTEAGKKRYGNMSSEKIYKDLKKQIRKKRKEDLGWTHKFATHLPIGEYSEKLVENDKKKREQFESSKEYKEWIKKVNALEKKYESDNPNIDEYDREWKELSKQKPKEDWNTLRFAKIYGVNGRRYANDFLTKGGKDLSIAYLRDLGYSQQVSEQFVNKMIKANRTLGDI